MRDLDNRIAEWRRSLVETATCPPDAIDELESHLREEYERLVRAGEQPERALELAISRLGTPEALGAEFAKNGAHVHWTPMRVAMALFAVAAVVFPAWFIVRWSDRQFGLLLAIHATTVTLGYLATLLLGGVATCYVVQRLFRELPDAQGQALAGTTRRLMLWSMGLTAVGIVLGMAWMTTQGLAVWSWDSRETGATLVMFWALAALSFTGQRADVRTGMLAALVGSAVVIAAWFGPTPFNAMVVAGAAMIPLVLFAVGLAPVECLRRRGA